MSQCCMFLRTDVAQSTAVNVAVVFSAIVLLSRFSAVMVSLIAVKMFLCRQYSGSCRLSLLPLGRPQYYVTRPAATESMMVGHDIKLNTPKGHVTPRPSIM